MKFYDFIDKAPAIGALVIIDGLERTLADRALEIVIERILPADMRELNLERFRANELDSMGRVADAAGAMPFLADRRVVVVTDAQQLKAAARRELLALAQSVPQGNTLIITDLVSPRSQRPEPLGSLAGRAALRIDTTANEAVRTRFIEELLGSLGATADARVIDELSRSDAELAAVRNDLEKLALNNKKITYKDLETESLVVEDPKAYQFASALVEGRTSDALTLAADLFANDSRNAGVPLVSAVATELALVWELARQGGQLPARAKWRERFLRPVAAKVGERRARAAYERAVRGFEAIVTGKIDDPRLVVELLTAELAALRAAR